MSSGIQQLAGAKYVSLETFKRDGGGVKTPVWIAGAGDHLYAITDANSYKVKRLERTRRARVAECNAKGDQIQGDWHDAQGFVVKWGDEYDRAVAALKAKYGLQFHFFALLGMLRSRDGRVVIRLENPSA